MQKLANEKELNVKSHQVERFVMPTVADERFLRQLIAFPIADTFQTHPENKKVNYVVSKIYTDINEYFILTRRLIR